MRIKAEQLEAQLRQGLRPVYLIHGDEALLVEEAADCVRQVLRQQQAERQVWHVEGRFDWSQVPWQEQTMSLFSSQRLLEIRLPSASPGKDGGELLRQFAEHPAEATTLLLICGKLAPAQQKAKWFTALDSIGVTVPVWPVTETQLPAWIRQRAQQKGLPLTQPLAAMMAERLQGNLFAAAQEIDKLVLLAGDGPPDASLIAASVVDNARFEAFSLMDQVYAGEAGKIPRMLKSLQAEGIELLAVFSAVAWAVHRCVDMAGQLQQGRPMAQVFASQKPPVWDKAQPLIRQALLRHSWPRWQQFLSELALIDRAAKGGLAMDPWCLLEQLCLQLAGVELTESATLVSGDNF